MEINVKRIIVIFMVLGVFLTLSGVCAEDNVTAGDDTSQGDAEILKNASFEVPSQNNYIKGESFDVGLVDDESQPISNRSVCFTVNGKSSNVTTDDKGIASYKLSLSKGTYTLKFKFADGEYNLTSGSKKILLITNSTSKIKASAYTAYVGVKNTYSVTLTAGGLALSGRNVTFKINKNTYVKKTNSKGVASLNINLKKGSYYIYYSYAGEEKVKKFSGKSKVTVKKGMPTKLVKANSIIYRHKTLAPFKVKLLDSRGNPLSAKKVKLTINRVTYTKKTDKNGVVSLNIKLKKGTYKLKVQFAKTSAYNKVSKTFTVKVKPKQARNNGLWLLSTDMASVNFKTLQKYGTKHIFLNAKSLERFSQSYVEGFIKNASAHKIKVHLWMQVFYNSGKWQNPVKNGKINYNLIKTKVNLAKKYAKVKGVSGVHFDYLRYPSNAYKYSNGVKAINYFTKQASTAIHKINSKLIVSAAVMPEPSAMKSAYGQDFATLSKHLDVIVPMVYKGNYNAGTGWIKKVTQTFVKQSKGAKIWTGIQTYKSDSDVTPLKASALMNDADAAAMGGAYGVILFRFGLINYINFNNV